MVRTEISLFLKNIPGELGRLSLLLSEANINIDALMIQDASSYVRKLFKARGKSLKRIASVASYNSMRKDSADFALKILSSHLKSSICNQTRPGVISEAPFILQDMVRDDNSLYL